MKVNYLKHFLCFSILGTFLYACIPAKTIPVDPLQEIDSTPSVIFTQTPHPNDNQFPETDLINTCISPLETMAYPVNPDDNGLKPGSNFNVLPPSPWQIAFPLSETLSEEGILISLEATRVIGDSIEIWINQKPNRMYDKSDSELYRFILYRPDTKIWKSIPAQVENSGVFVDNLFLTKDGSIWGQNYWDVRTKLPVPPILSKYNESTERFEFVSNLSEISPVRLVSVTTKYWSKVLLDSNDVFWVLVDNDAIYSYNSITEETKRHTEIPDIIVSDASIGLDGKIYFLDQIWNASVIQDENLFYFSPETEIIKKIPISLEPWPLFHNILVDHSGRLWLGSVGWREPDGMWYQIVKSPIFVTNVVWSGMENRWKTPTILMETSDHRLWFRSDNGLAWLSVDEKKWCWFTTYQSNILEDFNHNIWMIADGKLYRLPLDSQ